MNVKIGTEAAQFLFWECINRISFAVQTLLEPSRNKEETMQGDWRRETFHFYKNHHDISSAGYMLSKSMANQERASARPCCRRKPPVVFRGNWNLNRSAPNVHYNLQAGCDAWQDRSPSKIGCRVAREAVKAVCGLNANPIFDMRFVFNANFIANYRKVVVMKSRYR
jgi:hypothetical protein